MHVGRFYTAGISFLLIINYASECSGFRGDLSDFSLVYFLLNRLTVGGLSAIINTHISF